jgi:two-component system, NarL family, nitrate/nitrite response regulator NarL
MLGGTHLPAALMRLVGEDYNMDSEDDLTVPAAQMGVPILDHMPQKLSQQKTRILRCLMQGESNKIIARRFDITEATVKVHIKAILRKISVRNRTQAAIWAQSHLTNTVHGPIANGSRLGSSL